MRKRSETILTVIFVLLIFGLGEFGAIVLQGQASHNELWMRGIFIFVVGPVAAVGVVIVLTPIVKWTTKLLERFSK